jgi:hypothetical protein
LEILIKLLLRKDIWQYRFIFEWGNLYINLHRDAAVRISQQMV